MNYTIRPSSRRTRRGRSLRRMPAYLRIRSASYRTDSERSSLANPDDHNFVAVLDDGTMYRLRRPTVCSNPDAWAQGLFVHATTRAGVWHHPDGNTADLADYQLMLVRVELEVCR